MCSHLTIDEKKSNDLISIEFHICVFISKNNLETVYICAGYAAAAEREGGGTSPGPNLLPRIDGVRFHLQHTHTLKKETKPSKSPTTSGHCFRLFFSLETELPVQCHSESLFYRLRIYSVCSTEKYKRDNFPGRIGNTTNPDSADNLPEEDHT